MTKLLRTSALTALTTLVLALAACGPDMDDDVADGTTEGSDVEESDERPIATPDRGDIDDDLEDITVGPRPADPASAIDHLTVAVDDGEESSGLDGEFDLNGGEPWPAPTVDDLDYLDDDGGPIFGDRPREPSEPDPDDDGELDLADDGDAPAPELDAPVYDNRPDMPGEPDPDGELDLAAGGDAPAPELDDPWLDNGDDAGETDGDYDLAIGA